MALQRYKNYPLYVCFSILTLNNILTMSSGIFIKIRLDEYYQMFLRGYYKENDRIFKFPREDSDILGLAFKFNNLLMLAPSNSKPVDYGCENFFIEVPYQQNKDPFYYNFLSQKRNEIFFKDIRRAYKFHFEEKMMDYRDAGYDYKSCVELFQDEYNIDPKYFARGIKHYDRWKIKVAVQKHLQKSGFQTIEMSKI